MSPRRLKRHDISTTKLRSIKNNVGINKTNNIPPNPSIYKFMCFFVSWTACFSPVSPPPSQPQSVSGC
ncbi:hypothetical protein VTJ04DRAFT_4320 [Mycothermus thermophilus]|uniref:uncharacterized protein n=1 Tax=Humicola insolens TaxID=85995 RepID=UPI003741FAFA